MFFVLSKTLDVLVSPVSWTLALALVAAALVLARRPRSGVGVLAAAVAVLYAFSTGRVANALTARLERSARTTARPGVYDAVIVLTGMVDEAASLRSGRVELTEAADRIVAAFELFRDGRARTILISGGLVRPIAGATPEAELLASELGRWGVDPARIVVEKLSRNTRENAVQVARVVADRGWGSLLLVTSAFHMQRALGCFARVGLHPDALPVDWHEESGPAAGWLPRARALERSEAALREFTGRLVYRVAGYT